MKTESRQRLQCLAAIYAGYAHGDVMRRRREKWRLHNGLRERTVPFHIEDNGSYFRDLTPPLQCEESLCRELEASLLHAITAYERIDDDRIIPDRFVVNWVTGIGRYCDELAFTHADDGHGGSLGFESNRPIRDIDADFGKLRRRTLTLDRPATEQRAELAADVFRGLLPVEIGRCSSYYSEGIASKAVHLMGMEELYVQMAVNPEAVKRLLSFLSEDVLALGQWEEDQGLLTLNNDGNQGYCSGSSQFTDDVPGRPLQPGERIRSADRYGYIEAQEAAALSPDMFAEFLMPHFRTVAKRFRLLKFGCCEPVHGFMPHLLELHGLRKVSVTPWCDLDQLAGNCSRDVIWCRKPVPLKLCGASFDPGELRRHLEETLRIGAGHFVEFVFRDTNLLTGAMEERVAQACRIVREVSGHPEGTRL
jgi:hypothetical protein